MRPLFYLSMIGILRLRSPEVCRCIVDLLFSPVQCGVGGKGEGAWLLRRCLKIGLKDSYGVVKMKVLRNLLYV